MGQLGRVVGAYRRASETDDSDRSENHRERRGLWLFDEPDALVRVTGLLEPDDAAVLRAALAASTELLWRQGPGTRGGAEREDAEAATDDSVHAMPPLAPSDGSVDDHAAAGERVDADAGEAAPTAGSLRGLRSSIRPWRPGTRRRRGALTLWCGWPGLRWRRASGLMMAMISPRCCWSSTTTC